MTSEKRIEQETMLRVQDFGGVVFKNNTGTAFRGEKRTMNGKMILTNLQFIKYGLDVGSADLIGVLPVTVTPDMVGKKIGVMLSIEMKKDKFGSYRATGEQLQWMKFMKQMGAIAFVCDNPDDLHKEFNDWKASLS